MLSHHLSAVNFHSAWIHHHSGCVIMQLFFYWGCVPPRRELANRAQQVAPRQKALACFYSISRSLTQQIHTQDPSPSSLHTHTWLHTTLSQLQAPTDSGERQCRHCVWLYYTWNSGPHAFLIDVICTDATRVRVNSVSGAVFAPDLHSHCNCSSEDRGRQTANLCVEELQIFFFLSSLFQFKITHSYWWGGRKKPSRRDCAAFATVCSKLTFPLKRW